MQKGRVIKFSGGKATILGTNGEFRCSARKKLHDNGLYVGDKVIVGSDAVESVEPRKNLFTRPNIANVEQVIIVVSPVPKPDLILVDKLLVKCFWEKLRPIIVINKTDLATPDFVGGLLNQYEQVCEIITVSAVNNQGIDELAYLTRNKLSVLAGQSAVGKSAILNALSGKVVAEIGDLSKKTERGKHTTRTTKIYLLSSGGMLADTPGFTSLETDNEIKAEAIAGLCPDFPEGKCKFRDCNHIDAKEQDCAALIKLKNGELSAERYNRYKTIYREVKKREETKYG
ncbi:MAG: ribosome small subunit-dependent GTPase A [Firmicutes bacterium]|nr:ribosome small subunit-dependent GTPase A [Bacillota bacterium]